MKVSKDDYLIKQHMYTWCICKIAEELMRELIYLLPISDEKSQYKWLTCYRE